MNQHSDSTSQRASFIGWLRDSSSYIHLHRQRTFVIFFGGEAVKDQYFSNHAHDFALLNSLGIRLVLVHGICPQINTYLTDHKIQAKFVQHIRITDDFALQCAKQAAGIVRVEIEALLSMGLANLPMSGVKIRVVSGNFITAKPIGIIKGIDFKHTGEIRRVDRHNIQQQLELNNIVLISPVGYSPSGETFNLCAENVATEVAIALRAEKLIFLTEQACQTSNTKSLISQMTRLEAQIFIQQNPNLTQSIKKPLTAAIRACQNHVKRVHLVNRHFDGALLQELFSRNGIGTLISATSCETLRPATVNDITNILELIAPLEQQDKLIRRSRTQLEIEISDYLVIDHDGLIIACIGLHYFPDKFAQITCLAVHPNYRCQTRGQQLLDKVTAQAQQSKITQLFVLSTQSTHWFIERGFIQITPNEMPEIFLHRYNAFRNSKILRKTLC